MVLLEVPAEAAVGGDGNGVNSESSENSENSENGGGKRVFPDFGRGRDDGGDSLASIVSPMQMTL